MNHDLQIRSELPNKFILECLTVRQYGSGLKTASNLAQQTDFDWDQFLHLADEELVSPLLFEILRGRQIIPRAVEESLAQKHDYHARRNLFLLHELGQIVASMNSANVEVIVLKGAALSESIYDNIALRPMRDLDLLIRSEQLPAALRLLASQGYEQISVLDRDSYPVGLNKPGIEAVFIELHRSLFHSLYYQQHLSLDWFWETARPVTQASQTMRVLGIEAQILHLCGHIALHHLNDPKLLWLNDLAELINDQKEQISWDLLLDKAQTFQLVLPLRHVLMPLAQEWNAPVPEQTLDELLTLQASASEMHAYALSTAVKRSEGQGYWFRLNEISGWRRRIFYVAKWFFPTPASLRSRYQVTRPFLAPLAYLYHWMNGAWLGIEALVAQLRNAD